ncbi:MAG: hypothetical protein ACERJ1_15065 [Halodesulfovibrio sp.]|uniref:sodium:solute symporter family transporter n=1 Tax=Halodesulfovibrio sp. TaxID=1912772 RepID=UPI00359EB7F3
MSIDLIIILAYFLVMIGCGIAGIFFAKSNEDFLVAGRNLKFWMYFPCLASVILGGGATFGSVKLAYQFGFSGAWVVLMYGFGVMSMGILLSSKMANLRVISLSEMLEVRYAASARYISAIISCIYTAMIAVVQVIAIGTILHAFFGWDMVTSMVAGGAVSLLYTLLGGMWSVTITDVIQFVLMMVGVFGFLVPLSVKKAGGLDALFNAVPPSYFDPFAIGWDQLLMYFLLMYLGIMIGQDIWQRVFTAKSGKVATRGTITAGFFSILWGGAMAICGMAAFVLLPDLDEPQKALGQLVVTVMPSGLLGMVVAGLLSTLMSTVSGTILASSTLIINDLVKPFRGEMDNKQEMFLARVITFAVGIVVLLLAVVIGDVMHALDIAYALLSGCIFVPVVAGFFWRKATAQGAVSSIVVSGIVTTVCIMTYGAFSAYTIIYGILSSAVVLVVVSLMTGPPNPAQLADWEARLAASEQYDADSMTDEERQAQAQPAAMH